MKQDILGVLCPTAKQKYDFFDQYGPLLALNYFHENQSLLFDSYLLLMTRSVT